MGTTSGSLIQQQTLNASNLSQQWDLINLGNGYYKLRSKVNTAMVIDVTGASTADATKIEIYTDNGTNAQQFRIDPVGDGSYCIRTKVTDDVKGFDVSGASMTAGAQLMQYGYKDTSPNKQFYLEKVNPGTVDPSYIQTKAEYSSDGRYQTGTIDTRDNKTAYVYNPNTGTVASVTDPKGGKVNYTYDNMDRLTNVSQIDSSKTYSNGYTYENDNLKTITHNGTTYSFNYDNFGNTSSVNVGSQNLITNTYEGNNGKLTSAKYGNGQTVSYTYDRFYRMITQAKAQGTYRYNYDARGNLISLQSPDGTSENHMYDITTNTSKIMNTNGFTKAYAPSLQDVNGNDIEGTTYSLNNTNNNIRYTQDTNGRPINIGFDNTVQSTNYDALSRVSSIKTMIGSNNYTTNYGYITTPTANKTTTLLDSITNGSNIAINYTYDKNGNIETISNGTTLQQKYYYDGLNQLVREDNVALNKSIVYNYDVGGNITSKIEYPYTTGTLGTATKTYTYTYGNTNWKDQLTSFDGKAITYDTIGNPTSYNGNTYTWQNGRELAKIVNGSNTYQYKYNDSGIRIEKNINGTITKYYLEGTKIIYEVTGNNVMYYQYDSTGNLIGFKYNGAQYYYIQNAQFDIIGILNSSLQQIVSYTYDSWGKLISVKDANGNVITDVNNIGNINPFRYRSYYYDKEIGMYYLNSRYYLPEFSRFLNADTIGVLLVNQNSLVQHNLYAYCLNDPINRADEDGDIAPIILGVLGVAYIASTIYDMYVAIKDPTTGNVMWAIVGVTPMGKITKILKVVKVTRFTTNTMRSLNAAKKVYSSYIKRNFRVNLSILTGKLGNVFEQAHHVLPQKFRNNFLKADIRIDNPIYGSWVNTKLHQSWSYAYNREWKLFFTKYPNATKSQILNYAKALARKYGFKVYF